MGAGSFGKQQGARFRLMVVRLAFLSDRHSQSSPH
jgi:hypothetical protein